ncbi:MAG: hypothetical protein L0Z62_20330 [Gemmataceae bacterium]|nr:hypothetical protein [Gemmataceae bacterium]
MMFSQGLLAYIGPETVLPATSILAVLGGILLAFWQSIVQSVVRVFRFVFRLPASPPVSDPAAPAPPAQGEGVAPAPAGPP